MTPEQLHNLLFLVTPDRLCNERSLVFCPMSLILIPNLSDLRNFPSRFSPTHHRVQSQPYETPGTSTIQHHGVAVAPALVSTSRHVRIPSPWVATSTPRLAIRPLSLRATAYTRPDRPVTKPCSFHGSCPDIPILKRKPHPGPCLSPHPPLHASPTCVLLK